MVAQTGPNPYGSKTSMVAHGSTYKSMVQIWHQVAHLGPTVQLEKEHKVYLGYEIPISDWILHQFLVDLSGKGYFLIL